jgi:hypothetical protein
MMAAEVHFTARIDPLADTSIHPSSWFITHGLGGPAAGMFTEVVVPEFTDTGEKLTIAQQAGIVRTIADQLYGTRWAFHYPPEDYEQSIQNDRWSLTRRERAVITEIEVY